MKKLLFAFLAFSAISASAQSVSKSVGLKKGDQLEQVTKMKMNLTQEMMGQTMEILMSSTTQNLVEVKNTGSNIEVANTMKSALMDMDAMGQQMKFDSNKKEDLDGEMGAAYRKILNVPINYVLDNNGVVTKIVNKPEEGDENAMGNMLGGSLTDEKEGASFSTLANIPAKGAKVGDTWSETSENQGAKTVTTYSLKEIKGDEGIVGMNGDITMNREMEQQGMAMVMDLKGTVTGQYTFDVKTGIIKVRTTTTKASGNIEVMGQSIPMAIESTTESTVTKK